MIGDQRLLAVVPARGGSKGVPLKNLQPVRGVPLVAMVGAVLEQLPEIDRKVVSTDHEAIAEAAEQAGISADFRRPPELSGDRIGDLAVLAHALNECERLDGVRYDIVLMLQPTSPLRTAAHVRQTWQRLTAEALDSVWTVSQTDSKYHPLKQLMLQDGALGYYDREGAGVVARQQLDTLYHRNGAAYAFTRECLLEQKTILGRKAGAVVTEPMVSIDTHWDFKLVEFYLDQ